MYRRAVYPLLQRFDAERTHELVLAALSRVEQTPPVRRLIQRLAAYDDPRLHASALGLRFRNPIGLAAGLDKNAVAVQTWGALGWGHVEVGTVTPQPQAGNPRPRMYRLPIDQALINRMGFPGQGAQIIGQRLARAGSDRPIVGVNIGANKASVEAGRAAEDYVAALRRLHVHADYLTINISSPNTARLRDLHGRAALDALLDQITAQRDHLTPRKPLLLKIAPDLTAAELDDVLRVCFDRSIDGLIATNTTIARPPTLRDPRRSESGGLSGRPLRDRSLEVLRYLAAAGDNGLLLVSVGGVWSAADVWERLAAGAKLVQIYTGFVYEGPLLARRINRDLIRLLDQHGLRSIEDVRQAAVAR